MAETSSYRCPNCDGMLSLEIGKQDGSVTIYCPWGKCDDQRMNDGASGNTAQAAAEALQKIYDQNHK